jgi:putative membrane protein
MLAFSFILVVGEEYRWLKYNILAMLLIILLGFVAEYIGVNYGWLFGNYTYGETLGYKYGGVPVIIAFNWLMLCISLRSLVNNVLRKPLVAAVLTAALITAYDFILEPVAIRFGWWWWQGGAIPIYNYVSWFILSLIFQLFFRKMPKSAGRSYWMPIVQIIFFIILLLL